MDLELQKTYSQKARSNYFQPMVSMYSQYERVKDPRTFVDRRDVFSGENYVEEYSRIAPKHHVVMTDDGFQVTGEAGGDSHAAAAPAAAEEWRDGVLRPALVTDITAFYSICFGPYTMSPIAKSAPDPSFSFSSVINHFYEGWTFRRRC